MRHPQPGLTLGGALGAGGQAAVRHACVDVDAMMEQIRAELEGRKVATSGASQAADPAPLTTAELMERARAEVARQKAARGQSPSPATEVVAGRSAPIVPREDRLPRWHPATARLEDKSQYVLADFLAFDDEDFVDVVYQKLLRRPADPEGRGSYLAALRSGVIDKVEILGLIRFSDEGRRQGVHVDGLLLPYKLHRWRHVRVVGWFLGMGMAIVRLPRLAWRLQRMEASAARESRELGHLLDRVETTVEQQFANADGAINALRKELSQSIMSRTEGQRVLAARVGALQETIGSVEGAWNARAADEDARRRLLEERLQAHEGAVSGLADALHSTQVELAERLNEIRNRLQTHEDTLTARGEMLHTRGAEQSKRHNQVDNRLTVHDAAIARLDELIHADQRSLRELMEKLTNLLGVTVRGSHGEGGGEPALAAQYASFEATFRGGREEIKARAEHYLDSLAAANIQPCDPATVLDLGSGRGEWLEVLAEHGYRARGVDLNPGMLQESREHGHDVVEADVLDYLRTQKPDSFAAITSMHLVEHIPNPALNQLLDEALRVLRPGGVLILETPNPENVLVGSCLFYMDPTHLHPIPPPLLQWTVQARGFEQAVIERLTEHRGSPDLEPVSDKVPGAAQINQMVAWFTAPPDYAVIARKPASPGRRR